MHEYDKSSKWLIEHHGDSILRRGGVRGIEWWRSLQAELVLGGRKAMIESPVLKELMAENTRKTMQAAILKVLIGRFGRGARILRPALKAIEDDKQLDKLLIQSGKCPDLDSFKKLLEP
jgi:hypothetical protein